MTTRFSLAMTSHQFLSFLLCISSASAVFVSIDCGSSKSYEDENMILWTGDDEFIHNGESHSVPSLNSISHVINTLRVFTTRKKNCYHIDSAKQGRVLLRATFYYGNYDKKASPPTFELQFDGNHWTTVETSSTQYVYHEVIYVTKRNSISVCVAQTNPGQYPFISAIEVRSLEPYMYSNISDTLPLFLRRRVAFGSNDIIRCGDDGIVLHCRYPEDHYDRIWTPQVINQGLIQLSRRATNFSGPLPLADQPPPAVLKNAITAVTPTSSIQVSMGFPPQEAPVYLNGYFSEVSQLKRNEIRSFRVYMNNKPLSIPFSPPYDNCTQLYDNNLRASSTTNFSLVPTFDSTLAPLINAMEVFVVGHALTKGTNDKDVKGLGSLGRAFGVLQDWRGDPCLPAPYTWDWIKCNNDSTPRVTALFLGNFGLSGVLPDFSSMNALQTIDLHSNNLKGPIPDFLGTLPDLKTLNLANNQFNGSVPASLLMKNDLNYMVYGNPDVCTSAKSCPASSKKSSSSKNNSLPMLLGTIIQFIIILLLMNETGHMYI